MRIGVFDSGMGGLTVLSSLIKKNPNNEYIYFGDNYNAPYGNKTKEELFLLSSKIIDFFIEKKVDKVIIACGTISSNIYPDLVKKYKLPIIDVLTPTIEYLKEKKFPNIAVMATSMTIKSNVFGQIDNIKQLDCPLLVPLIESGKINSEEMKETLKKYLNDDIETIVLGCTHYPLIKDEINKCLNKNITFIDMGEILAKKLELKETNYKLTLYFSQLNNNINNLTRKMFKDYIINEMKL